MRAKTSAPRRRDWRAWLAAGYLCLGVAAPAAAQDFDCAHPMVQMEMNACAYRDYEKADAALNRIYGRLRAKLGDPGLQARLADAERAWIAYRDRQCDLDTAGEEGGSIHPMVLAMCLQKETETRSAELRRLLKCEEGDLSCRR